MTASTRRRLQPGRSRADDEGAASGRPDLTAHPNLTVGNPFVHHPLSREPRSRAVSGLLVLVLTIAAVVVGGSPALAAPATTSVTASISARDFIRGETVTISGTVKGSRAAKRAVVVERRSGTRWVRAARATSTTKGAYKVTVRPPGSSTVAYRVRVAATSTARAATSPTRRIAHYSCVAGAAPTGGMQAVFNRPGAGGAMLTRMREVVCSAANRSQIRVALYILDTSHPKIGALVRALKSVAVERHVAVTFVLDSSSGAWTRAAAAELRSFASVTQCYGACTRSGTDGTMHTKVLALSDSRWLSRVDPVVVLGSSNWSYRQLYEYWQTMAVFHGDTALYRAHVARFDAMRRCGGRTCSAGATTATTDAGRGMSVEFFPRDTGADTTVELLQRVSCTTASTIDVAMYLVTPARSRAISRELQRLRTEGCRVRLLVSSGGAYTNSTSALGLVAQSGVTPRCVNLMHGKFMVLTNVTLDGRPGQTVLQDGSQNWTYGGLRVNDDSTFTLSTATASTRFATSIRGLAAQYSSAWQRIAGAAHSC